MKVQKCKGGGGGGARACALARWLDRTGRAIKLESFLYSARLASRGHVDAVRCRVQPHRMASTLEGTCTMEGSVTWTGVE